jgi:hypothetical protein
LRAPAKKKGRRGAGLAILSARLVNQALFFKTDPAREQGLRRDEGDDRLVFLSTHGVPKAGTPIPRAECHPSLACGPARRFAEKAADGIPFVTADRAAPADSHKARDRAMSGPPGGSRHLDGPGLQQCGQSEGNVTAGNVTALAGLADGSTN